MSVLTDCDDVNEWSLFGGQLELVSLDTNNPAVADSWLENTSDSPEMARCNLTMDDLGITSSLKVWSCPTDSDQFVDCRKLFFHKICCSLCD
jgi:hypothetical protein